MNRRKKDKNKQIICVILFIFVLLSGVFYALYTTVGKELLAKGDGSSHSANVIRNETSDKTTVNENEEPIVDDKPLSNKTNNKTTVDKKINTNKTTTTNKKPNKNTNTTKPAQSSGLEVIREPEQSSSNNVINPNTSSSSSSGSTSGSGSTPRPKSTTAKIAFGGLSSEGIVKDYDLSMTGSGNKYVVSGKIYVEDYANTKEFKTKFNNEKVYLKFNITTPEAYLNDSILSKARFEAFNRKGSWPATVTNPTISYSFQYITDSVSDYLQIYWGSGDIQKYIFEYSIDIVDVKTLNSD